MNDRRKIIMSVEIREARAADAEKVIAYTKTIGGESDNLTFGSDGFPITVEEEADYLESVHAADKSVHLLALMDGEIIADGSLSGLPRRMSHRAELGIAVRKPYWNKGVGSMLMQKLIDYAKEHDIEIINLEVRSDNAGAIHLYQKFGFRSIGKSPAYFKIDDNYCDFDIMYIDLR